MTAQLSNVAIDISKHKLIKQAYEVCQAIEKCGASPGLTDAVAKASTLMQDIANAMDGDPLAVIDKEGNPMTRAECNDDRVFAICCKVGTPLYAAPAAHEQEV